MAVTAEPDTARGRCVPDRVVAVGAPSGDPRWAQAAPAVSASVVVAPPCGSPRRPESGGEGMAVISSSGATGTASGPAS